MKVRVETLLAKSVGWFGLAFALFSLLTVVRLSLAAAFIACAILFFRVLGPDRLSRLRHWLSNHELHVWLFILLLALAFRGGFFWVGYSGDLTSFQCGDGKHFWNWSKDVAMGGLPEVKSWATVAVYSCLLRLTSCGLGTAFVFNIVLQIATACLFYVFGRRVFGRVSATLAFAAYLLSPTFVMMAFMTISEHFFYLFISLCLLAVERCQAKKSFVWAAAAAVFAWLATWSRGEGALLILVAGFCILVELLNGGRCRHAVLLSFSVYFAVACLCGCAGWSFNRRVYGNNTVFCANDSWWPRLHGANVESHGRMASKMPIYKMYIADHPKDRERILEVKKKPNFCPKELVPYIRQETARRWRAMTLWTKVRLIVENWHYEWAHAYAGGGRLVVQGFRAVIYESAPVVVLALSAFGLWRRQRVWMGIDWLELAPLLLIGGMCCVLALYESNIRYGTMLLVLLPFYVARKGTPNGNT